MKRLCLLLVVVAFSGAVFGSGGGMQVLRKIPVAGDGGWDYLTVDEAARRLYVSHGSQVEVLDVDSGAVVGKVADTRGVHGIAIAHDLGRGFVSNGGTDTVTIFDLKTLAAVGTVPTGKKPDAIIFDPHSRRVFAFNGESDSATAIDAASGKVAGTVELGGGPEFAAADGRGSLFVNLEDKNEVVKFDAKTLKVEARWPLAPGATPTGMAMDRAHRRLFVGCRNKLMIVVNADTGKVVAHLPIGERVDAVAFDEKMARVYFSNGDGTISVFHEDSADSYTAVETVKTQVGARTMTLDPKTHHLFLSTAEFGPAPAPTEAAPRPRPPVKPGTFTVLVVGQ